jgi:hypothetical protein
VQNKSHNVHLSSSEIANLWTQYINDSMAACVTTHFLENVQDQDTRKILEYALSLSKSHLAKIREFLKEEGYPIPKGFTKMDLYENAPPLFTDTFMLVYFHVMTLHGLTGYAGAIGTSVRKDQREYFYQCNKETMKLYDMIISTMLEKGIFTRPPVVNAPNGIDFIEKQSFLTGWFGSRRPVNAIEISGIYYNMYKNIVKIVLEIGFSQVAQSEEIKAYFKRGHHICDKQYKILGALLEQDNLPLPRKWESEVTSSTTPPFTDKLMLFHIVSLVSASVGFYGAGIAVAQRRDISIQYSRLIAEISLYAEDGVNILIDNGWLEQPPTASDRNELAGL